jgi:DNA-binding response OmpR family regulator
MLAGRKKPLILCIDDYQSILTGWKMLLERRGYQVLTATDCQRAMDLFSSHAVDEVVLDSELKEMSGDIVAYRMKTIKPQVPILMISGNGPVPPEKLKSSEAFLVKADSITMFLETVRTLLNRSRAALSRFAILPSYGIEESMHDCCEGHYSRCGVIGADSAKDERTFETEGR